MKAPLVGRLLLRRVGGHGGDAALPLQRGLRLVCASGWESLYLVETLRSALCSLHLMVGMGGIGLG